MGRCYISTWSHAPMFQKWLFSFLASSQCQAEQLWWSGVNIMTCIRFIYRKKVYPTAWQSENTLDKAFFFSIRHSSYQRAFHAISAIQIDRYSIFFRRTGKRTSTALTFQLLYAFTSVRNEGFRIQGHSSGRSCSQYACGQIWHTMAANTFAEVQTLKKTHYTPPNNSSCSY